MKKSPFNFTPLTTGMSYTEIKRKRALGLLGGGTSTSASRQAIMEERLQANNPEAPQNQPDAPSVAGTEFVAQEPEGGYAGVSNQSNDVGYNTGANYIEQQDMMSGLTRKGAANSNVRNSTRRIGGTSIGGEDFGGYEIGEYQQERGGMAGRTSRVMAERTRFNAMEGLYGDTESRQASVGLGEVPGAFQGVGQEFNDDRQDQFNDVLFNPNAKSDRGMNEMYNNFYNTQGIV